MPGTPSAVGLGFQVFACSVDASAGQNSLVFLNGCPYLKGASPDASAVLLGKSSIREGVDLLSSRMIAMVSTL
jgi:hypothetical protein